MVKAYLIRTYYETHTLGVFTAVGPDGNILMECPMLELPWKDNKRRVSCIPEGKYLVRKRLTIRFGHHYHILDVPDRDSILQHAGNYTSDILGCQLPGSKITKLNADNIPDIENSRATLKKMIATLGAEYTLVIGSFEPIAFPHTISPSLYWQKK